MVNKQYFEISKDLEEVIIKLARSIKVIGIDNAEFEYMKDGNFYKISISEYKNFWGIVHREILSKTSRADIFKLGFNDYKITYKWSEEY